MYRLRDHNLTIETGRHRQTWLPKEDRLCPHCTQHEVETELHFLTTCPNYTQIRETFFPQFINQHKDFNQIQQKDKLPYILGETSTSSNLAARYVKSCHDKRTSSRTEPQVTAGRKHCTRHINWHDRIQSFSCLFIGIFISTYFRLTEYRYINSICYRLLLFLCIFVLNVF